MLTTRPVNRIDQPTDGYLGVDLDGPAQERIGSQRTRNLVYLLESTYACLDPAVNPALITLFQDKHKQVPFCQRNRATGQVPAHLAA